MASITFDTLKFADRLEKGLATRADLLELKMDIIKWMVGLALAQVGLLIGILVKML